MKLVGIVSIIDPMHWYIVGSFVPMYAGTQSLVIIGLMKPTFEILLPLEKQRYSKTAVRFPFVIHDIPRKQRGFGAFALAGCARSGACVRPLVRKIPQTAT